MRKWVSFGEQVNRLVYALAGKKFQGDIERANGLIADMIHYSRASVRMMRQGYFRPRDDRALELMVEIGCRDAELTSTWARSLLRGGRHPNPEVVILRLYSAKDEDLPENIKVEHTSPIMVFSLRVAGMLLFSLATLFAWAYLIQPVYPAPHELTVLLEGIWGLLIGLGLVCGIALADFIFSNRDVLILKQNWKQYLMLLSGGVLGALFWKIISSLFFPTIPGSAIKSGSLETFVFGCVYGLGYYLVILRMWMHEKADDRIGVGIGLFLAFVPLTGLAALVGFFLAIQQPSFANQKDVDMFVGVSLRLGLIIGVGAVYPNIFRTWVSYLKDFLKVRKV